ncbi:MAG: DUF6443 domain-containing protein, partial [Bacteroidota bacterium]
MKRITNLLLVLVTAGVFGQQNYTAPVPSDGNYIVTRTYQDRPLNAASSIQYARDVVETIQYFDGLGRGQQTIGIGHTPTGADLTTPYQYDAYGRMTKEWLPFPSTTNGRGGYKASSTLRAQQYYEAAYSDDFTGMATFEVNAYSEKDLEPSPLGRVLKQGAPGKDWALGTDHTDHSIEFVYGANTHDPTNVNNANNDNVRRFTVDLSGGWESPSLNTPSYYAAGELTKVVTQDENHGSTGAPTDKDHSIEEFTDKNGRVVLKRTYNNGEGHDTYYVYDDFGNLSYVLPPLVDTGSTISQAVLDELCYQYRYDHRNRLVEKHLPGKTGWELIVYNTLDQPIMTQDPNLAATNEWLFTKYDAFGRVAYTGKVTDNSDRSTVQTNVNAVAQPWVTRGSYSNGGIDIGYKSEAYPTAGSIEVLTVNYYDDYAFDRAGTGTSNVAFGVTTSSAVKGLATGTKIKVLETNDWTTTVTFYDDKARPIYTHSNNAYLGTVDVVESQLDFGGKPLKVKASHSRNGTTIVTLDNFIYDAMGRLLSQTQCIGDENLGDSCEGGMGTPVPANPIYEDAVIAENRVATSSITLRPPNGQSIVLRPTPSGDAVRLRIDPTATGGGGTGGEEERIVTNSYDALGQLVTKNVGGAPTGSSLQTVDYSYNVRGWMKGINNTNALGSDLFAFRIGYNAMGHTGTPLYNGNISETEWITANDNFLRWYVYGYDALNRLTAATENTNNYYVNGIQYDKNGNLRQLRRKGVGALIDDLYYTYYNGQMSNRLQRVSDSSGSTEGFRDGASSTTEYTYDANGNMVRDDNKGITGITYNHLNLPTTITVSNSEHNGTIAYIYNATGTKLGKNVGSSVTLYAGNYIYAGGTGNEQLQFFNHPEGYISPDGSGGFDYIYQYKDHLGNVRLSYTEDPSNPGSPTIIEENNYYPFGLKHKGYNEGVSPLGNDVAQKWKYNGVEFEEGLGLELYEMEYRQYDPAIARFTSMDPLTHWKYSPYQAFDNNPIFWADPSGANAVYNWDKERYEDENGNEVSFEQALDSYGLNYDGSDGDSDENEGNEGSDISDLASISPEGMMNALDPEDDIREYEKNERIIIRNSIKLEVLSRLTTTGQVESTIASVVQEWYESSRTIISPNERDA